MGLALVVQKQLGCVVSSLVIGNGQYSNVCGPPKAAARIAPMASPVTSALIMPAPATVAARWTALAIALATQHVAPGTIA